MKSVDLGFMKIPFEGDWPLHIFLVAMAWGAALVAIAMSYATPTQPALSEVSLLMDRCNGAVLITALWALLYYNFLGIQACCTSMFVFEMASPSDVEPQFLHVASRVPGNTLEQGAVFLPVFWLYVLFVDYGTALPLGVLYLLSRLLYAPCYIVPGAFTVMIEFATQPGYAVIGTLLLGLLIQATSGDWASRVSSYPVSSALLGYALGQLSIFPGLPFGPFLTALHFK